MPWNQYFVYFMTNFDLTVLYIGVTNSLERRVWEHKNGFDDGFTRQYHCDRLVYFEEYSEIRHAIAREKQLKGWTRAKKNALVNRMNAEWNDLAADWYVEDPSASLRSAQDDRENTP